MGKMKKLPKREHKMPLNEAIEETNVVTKTKKRKDIDIRLREDDEFVDISRSKKILQQAREQQEELMEDVGSFSNNHVELNFNEYEMDMEFPALPSNDYTELNQNLESINPEDEEEFEMFMNKNAAPTRKLCDIIMEKINEKQTDIESTFQDTESTSIPEIDEKTVQYYKDIGEVLSRYRSGKLPKAFKLIPRNPKLWEQYLILTDPDRWSSATMYQAVRIFTSNLKDKMAQRFFSLVLLPRIRDEIRENQRLNFHLYQSLRKALFKPAAFMKGILIPLCESGDCTLREATIIGSILQKNSVPVLHSSATIIKIAEMDYKEYSGAHSIFLQVFLNKKYALPFRVIDSLVFHFLRFERDSRNLPVLWHQALLVFVQRYKQDISSEQRDSLFALLRSQSHPKLTSEIRRELQHAQPKDLEGPSTDIAMSKMIV